MLRLFTHPAQVKYKVGDVVRYRDFGLTCAVVAWDTVLRAPEEWVKLVNKQMTLQIIAARRLD